MRKTRLVFVGLVWAGLLLFFFLHARSLDREKHSEEVSALLDLQHAHERLLHEILLTRGDVRHSDEGIEEAFASAESSSLRLGGDGILELNPEYRAFYHAYRDELERAGEHVARAVGASMAWKSALYRLPRDIETLEGAGDLDPERRSTVQMLLGDLALFHLSSDVEPGQRVGIALARLRGDRWAAELASDIERSIRAKAELDGEIALIDAPALEKRVQQLMATHESAFDEHMRESDLYRLGMYILSIVLLLLLLQNMHELKKRTRELHEANHKLEERVEERTRRLSVANAALQVEVVERQRAEQEARTALESAEAASRAKSEFLANMSHEIRTPMTSILGFSERLLDEGLTDTDKVQAVSTIRRNGDYLLQIINDILDISKIEAGKITVERIACSPRQIVAEVYSAMDVRAAIEGIEFGVAWKGRLPETIVTDPVRLKQVLLNLVGNAIKFTLRGTVRLEIEFKPPQDGSAPLLSFGIHDSGIGMDEATIARLFQPFMQADSSTTRRFGGTGLGLSISRHLVERLGGTLSVQSEPGVGSTFTFTIETGPVDGVPRVDGHDLSFLGELAEADVRRATPLLHGARILLAEDGEDNRRLLGYVLAAAQAQVDVVVNGQEAIDAVMAAQVANSPYHVILMDMQMPVLDGYGATRKLREKGCRSPIIALTAHAMATDREKCIEAGCDDFCTKPIVRNTFVMTIARYVGKHSDEPRGLILAPLGEDDDAELEELVRLFVADLGSDVAEMRAAIDSGDLDALAQVAHRLKGAAGSYGFPSLTTHAASLERGAKNGAEKAVLAQDFALIVALCNAARAERGL